MKIKVQENDILCTDIIPNIKIAEFNDELALKPKKRLALNNNYGKDFIGLYEQHRTNMHIVNMVEMIKKMEALYTEYDYDRMVIRRGND